MACGGQCTCTGIHMHLPPCPFPALSELKVKMKKKQHYQTHQAFPTRLQTSLLLNTIYTNGSDKAYPSTYNSRPTSDVVSSKKPFHGVGSHPSLTP